MAHDTVLRLAQVPGIVGIKEATGNIERAQWLIRETPEHFAVYSGDDPTAVALMLCGGQGNVSVTANVAPRLMHELCVAAIAGDVKNRHGHPDAPDAGAQAPVRRSQPDPRQMGHGPHGPVRPRLAPAHDAADHPQRIRGGRRSPIGRSALIPCRIPLFFSQIPTPMTHLQAPGALAPTGKRLRLSRSWPCAALLGACSVLQEDKIDYKSAKPVQRWKCRPT
jgi:hypothetical protein